MPTSDQLDAVRYDLDADESAMPDAEIDTLYTRASNRWPGNALAVEAQVRLYAITRLLAGAAKLVDYTANQSSEKLSQIKQGLRELYAQYTADLQVATEDTGALINMGGLRRYNPRTVELPSDIGFPNAFDVDMKDIERDPNSSEELP